MNINKLKNNIIKEVDKIQSETIAISKKIHSNPELLFEEHFASNLLSSYLEKKGFLVRKNIANLKTGFHAETTTNHKKPSIALIAEYDALPGVGHACGHNMIAAISVGAGVALLNAGLGEYGKINVIGTPGEEGGGGKIILINNGVFNDIDAALMAHPSPHTRISSKMLAIIEISFTFKGISSHAAAFPHEGVNALDGVILTFNNINALRQQIRDDARIHGIITEGGKAPNIIPETASAKFFVRAVDLSYFNTLINKVKDCAKGAAISTGCRLTTKTGKTIYQPFKVNNEIASIFRQYLIKENITEDIINDDDAIGSSDIGNVSQIIPTLHAEFSVGPKNIINHSPKFTKVVVSKLANKRLLQITKSIALTAADLILSKEKLNKAKKEFNDK